jgi:ATP-dependent Clp protease protease subunit
MEQRPPNVTTAQAERNYYLASAEAERANRDKLAVETEVLREDLAEKRRDRAHALSVARARRTYDFVGEVTEYEVETAVDELNDWIGESQAPVTIRLCSPGGSVFDGLFLFDFIRDVRRRGVLVTTHAFGYAASMASVLSQAGDHRVVARNAWYMVHEPSSIALGKAGDIRREAQLLDRLHRQLCGIVAERSHLSVDEVVERSTDKDWWMPAEEAREFGFFDELR